MLTPQGVSISIWSATIGTLGGVSIAAMSWIITDLNGTDAVLALISSGLTGGGLGLAAGVVFAVLVGPPLPDPRSRCRQCRYPNRGLTGLRCPECGVERSG
jgi:hypothetical protein